MKKRLLLIMMILFTLLASSCVTSVEPTGTEITPSGTLRVTLTNSFSDVTPFINAADGLYLSGQVDIILVTENVAEVIRTIPSSEITIERTDAATETVVLLIPYSGLSYNTEYSLRVSGLTFHLTQEGEVISSPTGDLGRAFTTCPDPDAPPADDETPTPTPVANTATPTPAAGATATPTLTPSMTIEPVVPTTGDSTTPILWLAAAVLAMTGAVLLMRRRA